MKYLFLILVFALTSCAPIEHTNARPDAHPDIVEPGAPDAGPAAPSEYPCVSNGITDHYNANGEISSTTEFYIADLGVGRPDGNIMICGVERRLNHWGVTTCGADRSSCLVFHGEDLPLVNCVDATLFRTSNGQYSVSCGWVQSSDADRDGTLETVNDYRSGTHVEIH